MALEVGDVVSITDVQEMFGQEVLNKYYYQVTVLPLVAPWGLDDVLAQFVLDVMPAIIAVQSFELQHIELQAKNETNGIDIFSLSTVVNGAIEVEGDDSFTAYGIRLNRVSAITRSGQKRLAGVDQNGVEGNAVTSDQLVLLQSAANAMCLSLEEVDEGLLIHRLRPVIVGRNTDGSLDLTRKQFFLTATPNALITSQVSRKQR